MDYHIVEARYVGGHVVWLRFRDGTCGEIDLAPALRGPVFEPLRNPTVFRQFRIHPEFHTLVWPTEPTLRPSFYAIMCALRYNRKAERRVCVFLAALALAQRANPAVLVLGTRQKP